MKNILNKIIWSQREYWVDKKPQFMWDFWYWLDCKINENNLKIK